MFLKEYADDLHTLLDATPFITAVSLAYEERPPIAGLIKAIISFADGSQLDLREFLTIRPKFQVIKYAYHYQRKERLIFRYDNANDSQARNLLSFPSHKHVASGILEAEKPSWKQVLQEIVSQLKLPE
jgi:hypothetical protein